MTEAPMALALSGISFLMAVISAWSVESFFNSFSLWPLEIILPLQTTTAPTGVSPLLRAFSASFNACLMNHSLA